MSEIPDVDYGTWEVLRRGSDIALLAAGTIVLDAVDDARALASRRIQATVVNCCFLKLHDGAILREVVEGHSAVLTLEEGAVVNGFGASPTRETGLLDAGRRVQVRSPGLPDRFVDHGARDVLLRQVGLDAEGIVIEVRRILGDAVSRASMEGA